MFPYRDENPAILPPYVTVAMIALNVAAWILIQGMGSALPLARSVCDTAHVDRRDVTDRDERCVGGVRHRMAGVPHSL